MDKQLSIYTEAFNNHFKNLKMSKRNPEELYLYESMRIDKYTQEFQDVLDNSDLNQFTKDRLLQLFLWNGNARAIKSKAYQELKKQKF